MRIQHNIMAMNAYRNYNNNTKKLSGNLEKLSSGYKINRAGDDAAGLAISEKMRAQITGLDAAQKNVKDGISLVKTAEGAMQEIQDMLNRMDYLATQSANGTYDNEVDRAALQKEVNQLKTEINRIADSANFNGIKLLDGSLDEGKITTKVAASAISEITTNAYGPKGASDAFTANFRVERPEAVKAQTNASFSVKLDDINISGLEDGDKIELTVGDAKLTFTADATTKGTVKDAATLAAELIKNGKGKGNAVESADGATVATAAAKSSTADWDAEATGTGAYLKVEGHWYKMSVANTNEIKFDQVDYMGTSGEVVDPNYNVSFAPTDAGGTSKLAVTGTVNWQNQRTVSGKGIGTSQQAQVAVDIDFSKLKDGDKLIAGDKTYTFSIGKDSKYADTTKYTPGADEKVIDLRTIFAEESDMADDAKQSQAMVKIVGDMAGANSATWSIGNQGVADGVGTLTFQSLSSYKGDATGAADADKEYIASDNNNEICDMRTEASVMKQFYTERPESGATVSFNVDPTKIKVGDTFTIAGKTFEFTDGADASSKNNVAIDLSSMGVSNGLLASQTGEVLNKMKTAIEAEFKFADGSNKYNVTVDKAAGKLTIASADDAATNVFENRTAAEVKLPTVTTTGKALQLQIGDTSDSFNQMKVSVGDMHTTAMKIDGIDISNQDGAAAAVQTVKDAINYVSSVRGDLGAIQNRLDHTANNLSVMAENIQDAESTIRDTDVADEMMKYVKNNILVQSAQAMLAQANQVPQGVLQLLG